jgi:hypothetical protein
MLTALTVSLVIQKKPVMHPVKKVDTETFSTKNNEKRGKKQMPAMLMLTCHLYEGRSGAK